MHLLSLVPTAPLVKDLTVIDSVSVYVEWEIPLSTNGALTFYTISYTVDNSPVRNVIVPFNGENVSHKHIIHNILWYNIHLVHAGTVL